MPVTCVVPPVTVVVVLSMAAHCCPFTMRTWWMGPVEAGRDDVSFVVSIRGRWIRGAATIGGGAGAMGTLMGMGGFGRTYVMEKRVLGY